MELERSWSSGQILASSRRQWTLTPNPRSAAGSLRLNLKHHASLRFCIDAETIALLFILAA